MLYRFFKIRLFLSSSKITGFNCCGSPTSKSCSPLIIGTSATAVLHWLASSIITISKYCFGSPNRWADIFVVATTGNILRNFWKFSSFERYWFNCLTASFKSLVNIISVSSLYFGSDNLFINLADVKFKNLNSSSLSCEIKGFISSSVISPISLSVLFTLTSCSPCKFARKGRLLEEESIVFIISFRSLKSSFSSYLRSKSLKAFVLCSS